ncbi:MAG: hypothetical protein IT305_23605 [Chloroflexi bacterium]|nr:hypothetical protein [Chloroflexota bacterium]
MDYGKLVRDAWQITWRHPFLWILGLFAGGTAGLSLSGGGSGGTGPPPNGASFSGGTPWAETIGLWVSEHIGLIIAAAGLLAVLAVVGLILSLISQGGITSAIAEYANGRATSSGRAWRTGLHLFWRYTGLWLVLIGIVAMVGGIVAAAVALIVGLVAVADRAIWAVAPGVLVGLVLMAAGIGAGIIASIVVPFAQRAIALRDLGPLAALRDGWLVLRGHPGASVLVWLLNLGLTFAAGLVATVVMLAAIALLGIPAAVLWSAFAFTAPTIGYLALAVTAALVVLLTLLAIANTFSWSYWTLAYLRLQPGQPAEPPA